MQLSEFLDQIRSHYVDTLAAAVAAEVKDPAGWLVEAAFAPPEPDEEGGAGAADAEDEGGLELPVRHDLVPMKDGEPGAVMVIRSETIPTFEQVTLDVEGLPLILSPFTWDQCNVLVQGLTDETDWQPILDWFDKWFDAGGNRTPDERGLLNVIHALYPPEANEDGSIISLDLDLGSAPVEALLELISTLHEMGAEAVALGGGEEEGEDEATEDEADEN